MTGDKNEEQANLELVEVSMGCFAGENMLGKQEDDEMIVETKESVVAHVDNVPRKRNGKGHVVLKGISTKKRNAQAMVSPRKKLVSKNSVHIGDGLKPKPGPCK